LRAPPLLLERAAAAHTPVLRTRLITGEFLQRAAVLIEELVAPRTRVQGTMVDIQGIGVLIEGPAGIGKSETALGLIARGSSLVADDVTELRRDAAGGLRASAVPATRYHMELRGLGIIHVPSLLGVASVRREKRLDLIVRLEPAADGGARESTEPAARELLGVAVPCVALPVAAGRDPVHLVHLAALNFRLRQLGHDAAKELDQRLVQMLERGGRRTSD
jgi:HPr kinase/phosphorylase